ncbi:MAG: PHP domain-containing protein [Thermoplasmatales archaeon]|nr:MAG: PHP domain-containing protein [Thermoplasmatales archaeon]
MLKLDLHLHSQYSDDGAGSPQDIIKSLRKKGLHGMALTDHNTVESSLKALKVAPKGFIVIPGIEISTADGHMLALNIKEDIAKALSVEETVDKIIDAGGIAIAPHLFRNMSGIKKEKLEKIHTKIPAIEVYNSCSLPKTNIKTARIAKTFNLGGIGGSDSHDLLYVGYAYTIVDSTEMTIDAILSEINKKKTWGEGIVMPLEYRRARMLRSFKQFFKRGFKRI